MRPRHRRRRDIRLHELGRRDMHPHGRLENIDDGDISNDPSEGITTVESCFN
ncbi:hypothetical protein V3C41_01895 [Paenarthrobacter nicotinovorans]|uniref:Uncharacterized protein n=1 Tax=Paenarthrobacter nicotinovorans TaxID=29320 RepID=A0ABV0GMP0_PAENI